MSEKKRWQAFLWRFLYPGWLWVVLLSLLSAAALVYVFTAQKEDTILAYATYVVSFYALVIACALLWKQGRAIRQFLYHHQFSSRYLTDFVFRTRLGLYPSFCMHGLYAAFHVAIGVYDRSPWFGALYAFYAFGNAIKNMIKCRKLYNPILSAAKMISFATAMVSMLSLQAAMFQSFGGTLSLQRTMSFWTGSAVCVFLFGMALYMIVHGNRQLQKIAAQQGAESAVKK